MELEDSQCHPVLDAALGIYHQGQSFCSVVKCDFSYSCAAADKISTDLRRRAVPLR